MLWNTRLFLLLNAPVAPDPMVLFCAHVLAESPVVIVPALLVWLWMQRPDPRRAGLLAATLSMLLGQTVNLLLGSLWFEPRPFMIGIGRTLLAHAADNGFPSDHSTLMFALGTGLILTGAARVAGVAVGVLGLGAAWARVYLGVHFPIDVLTGIPVGAVSGMFAHLLQPTLRRYALPPAEMLYERILAVLHLPAAIFPRGVR